MDDKAITFNVSETNFHPILKDIENMFYLFMLSVWALSDYDVQNVLKIKSKQEDYLFFGQMLDKFNNFTNLKIKINKNLATSELNILKEMILIGKSMAVVTYEFLSASNYKKVIKEDEEFKFLKHIRNSAAHNNSFDFKYQYGKNKGEWILKEDEVINWNGKKICRKLQGSPVFNDFVSLFDVFLLAKHFSGRLIKIDEENKK